MRKLDEEMSALIADHDRRIAALERYIVALESGVDLAKINSAEMSESDWEKVGQALARMGRS